MEIRRIQSQAKQPSAPFLSSSMCTLLPSLPSELAAKTSSKLCVSL